LPITSLFSASLCLSFPDELCWVSFESFEAKGSPAVTEAFGENSDIFLSFTFSFLVVRLPLFGEKIFLCFFCCSGATPVAAATTLGEAILSL
jgi:hypothetical protein